MANFIQQLAGQKPESIARQTRRSSAWFRNKLKQFAKNNRKGISSKPVIGKMYTYQYDPKWKDTLPVYDIFPLVLIINIYSDGDSAGWLGLNLHYLPPRLRVVLLNELIKISNNKKLSERSKLKLTYGKLKSASVSKYVEPTLHRYLRSHIKSKIVTIPAEDWYLAASLPFAKFRKKSKMQVYSGL